MRGKFTLARIILNQQNAAHTGIEKSWRADETCRASCVLRRRNERPGRRSGKILGIDRDLLIASLGRPSGRGNRGTEGLFEELLARARVPNVRDARRRLISRRLPAPRSAGRIFPRFPSHLIKWRRGKTARKYQRRQTKRAKPACVISSAVAGALFARRSFQHGR